ncbi:LysR family transcriptional regulator [Trinickia symbiotica]|uniref:LysR family transcriptional regulator n=1 Tax=Trinickia symbiotica TaxID=863227 RepID=A0A2N7X611_9BURK|nr:LysR family transcriptional regulator [Trinickia symbiotica]PMS36982.1 LysR family transcriptional regulator [Trinickia symbiotica]PPK41563.1 LysR family transcriptional regulator [Trinickia symbiotica]
MNDWNDLRLVLAVHRAANLTVAAARLNVAHSTAFRRLKALETRLGVRLFERLSGGVYQATEAGQRMAAAAERMEDEALALDRDLTGRDHRVSGRLRVTSSETLAYSRLTRHLAGFRQAHPGVAVDLFIDNRVLDLSRREADVALRPVRPRQGDLWGRRLARIAWGLYATPDYLAARESPSATANALAHHAVIGWEEGATGIQAAQWLSQAVPEDALVYRTNSLVNQLVAARAGIGLALLPCYLGDSEDGVVRATPEPVPDLEGELWIVAHADLKGTARVRAFFDVVGDGLSRERPLFEGLREI